MDKKIKKTVIITGYKCNNMCQFCIDEHRRDIRDKNTREIMEEMILARERGTTYLELIGGETSIRSDVLDLLKHAKGLGFQTIAMATNGRMLSYNKFAEQIVEAGLTDLIFSIHGHNEELHDKLTRVKGSYIQLMNGFENVKELLGLRRIGTNTTIVKENYPYVDKIGTMLHEMGVRNSEFIFVDPTCGGAHDNFDAYVPRISDAAPYIRKCLDIGKKGGAYHWTIRYVPLCYFQEYLDQISELGEVETFETEHLAPDFQNFDVEGSRKKVGRSRPEKCKPCKLYDKCEGVWNDYLKNYGDTELKPIL